MRFVPLMLFAAVAGAALAENEVTLEPVATGLTAPNLAIHAGDGSGRLFIVDQTGKIHIVDKEGNLLPTPFLDIADRMVPLGAFGPGSFDERGLLGLAFPKNFKEGKKFYAYYSAPRGPDIDITFEELDIPRGVKNFHYKGVAFDNAIVTAQGDPPLYCSGIYGFEVAAGETATITFDNPVNRTQFYATHKAGSNPGEIQVILGNGNVATTINPPLATQGCDPDNFFTVTDPTNPPVGIKQLRLTAAPGSGLNFVLDDLKGFPYNNEIHVSEFAVSASDPNVADPDSERILLVVPDPQFNHNAGMIDFGPDDGYLYIAIGDGGAAHDRGIGHDPKIGNGQSLDTLLGKMLRIDVTRDDFPGEPLRNYGIPADNPFVGKDGLDEIWAFGLRNPFRWSFDAGPGHRLILGDVGQALFEEVDLIEKGGNYGWNIREGFRCFDPDNPTVPPPSCPDTGANGEPLLDPILAYGHSGQPTDPQGLSAIGGYFYHGTLLPDFADQYLFGDWSRGPFGSAPNGSLFVAREDSPGQWSMDELNVLSGAGGRMGRYLLGLGQDAAGEVYVCTSESVAPFGTTGAVFRMREPIPCDQINRLKAKCTGKKVKAIVLTQSGFNRALTVDIGGQRAFIKPDNGKGTAKVKRQSSDVTVTLLECPEFSKTLQCE